MKSKTLLSLDDLYAFYSTLSENVKFSASDNDSVIVVHIQEPYAFSKKADDELNMMTHIRFCHTEKNLNKCRIKKEVLEDAMPSAYNIPILGYIYKNDDGDYVFAGHEFYVENGEKVYEEIPVGTVPESADLEMVYDSEAEKYYLEGDGVIWKIYSKASDILEREEDLSVSIEIYIDELSYDSKDKILDIDKFRFSGVTILQEDRETGQEIQPAMTGAKISINDFSKENNSIFSNKALMEEIKKFNANIDALKTMNENNRRKEDDGMDKFESLLTQYGLKAEDVTFETEGLSDEELEQKFASEFKVPESKNDAGNEPDDKGGDKGENMYSLTLPDGTVKEFSLSLDDIQYALFTIVNETYGELDNDFYSVSVYPDDSKVVMHSWYSGASYRQTYKRRKDNFTLEGDRVAVHSIWVTDDEEKALDDAKSNYSAMSEKLSKYESEQDKIDVLQSEEYQNIFEVEDFKKLSERENYFDLSVDEVKRKADDILLHYAKTVNFSVNDNPTSKPKRTPSKKPFMSKSAPKAKGYGSIFSRDK